MNHVILLGRIGQDLELVKTQSGISKVSFSLAVDGGAADDGTRRTEWIDIEAWRTTAEFIQKWFDKGDPIILTGALRTQRWKDRDGNSRKKTIVTANAVEFVPKAKAENAVTAPLQGQNAVLNQNSTKPSTRNESVVQGHTEAIPTIEEFEQVEFDDEDLPF